jgi:hypothetical protein
MADKKCENYLAFAREKWNQIQLAFYPGGSLHAQFKAPEAAFTRAVASFVVGQIWPHSLKCKCGNCNQISRDDFKKAIARLGLGEK